MRIKYPLTIQTGTAGARLPEFVFASASNIKNSVCVIGMECVCECVCKSVCVRVCALVCVTAVEYVCVIGIKCVCVCVLQI